MFNEKEQCKIIFGFIKKCSFTAMKFFSCIALKFISMNNQKCKVRPKILIINSNEPLFYPYSVLTNKCSGSCSDPHAKICFPDVIKDMIIKVFNLM